MGSGSQSSQFPVSWPCCVCPVARQNPGGGKLSLFLQAEKRERKEGWWLCLVLSPLSAQELTWCRCLSGSGRVSILSLLVHVPIISGNTRRNIPRRREGDQEVPGWGWGGVKRIEMCYVHVSAPHNECDMYCRHVLIIFFNF